MGILGAARWLPYLAFGLLAGAWLDRVRRRPVLIVTHVGRALLLASVPAGAVFGWLRIEQLYVITLALGSLMIFSDAAYQALLPTLVTREDLVDGNSKLELSRSAAQIVGPGLGGWLVQVVGAPMAVAVDAVSFAFDAVLVASIRQVEPPPAGATPGSSLRREIGEGLRWVFGSPVLRPIQAASMSFIGANAVWSTVYVLYATRDLHVPPAVLGLIFAAGGPGALAGALTAGALTRRFGLGVVIVGTHALAGASFFLNPLAVLLGPLAVPGAHAGRIRRWLLHHSRQHRRIESATGHDAASPAGPHECHDAVAELEHGRRRLADWRVSGRRNRICPHAPHRRQWVAGVDWLAAVFADPRRARSAAGGA